MADTGFSHWLVSAERGHRRIAALAVIFAILAVFLYSAVTVPVCQDEACFISYANMCGTAVFTNKISTATVLYETDGCMLRKTVTGLDSTEPDVVREALVGKSMVCSFIRNDFSPLFLTRLSYGLDAQCEGELRDAIARYQSY